MLSEPQTLVHPGTESPAVFARKSITGSNSEWIDTGSSTVELETMALRNRDIGKAGSLAKQHNVILDHSFVESDSSVNRASCSITLTHSASGDHDYETVLFRMLCRCVGILLPNIPDVDDLTLPPQFSQIFRGEP
jgi:hypothetical protein